MTTLAQDLFAQAHDLDPAAREAFLAKACGEDAELRLEVQRLLVDAERAQSFFSDDDGATLGAEEFGDTFTEAEGDVVGHYTLRQQIGEGGFGTVWMAEQSVPISRMVALKVIKAGMDTKQVLARFEAERQALAMMDHPNIAKVLDAGATSAGRPYFAMELVKGIPITQFCDQQNFGPRRRLELFKDVCSAVQHAHQKGIIHRDLKPSNIMVTLAADVPVVKVIDFGIAKATQNKLTEKTLFTRFEQFLGTPVYMSPEQAAMSAIDIDTRSDIYSLGVLLYELLAGAPPFDQKSLLSAGYDEMRRIIAEDEPPKPSTRCTETQANTATTTGSKSKKIHLSPSSLKGELDWIVMKAIEKDRTRRYETANAFAADIGRYLADEPVQAAAASAGYKFKKFARRNKTSFGVAAAMVVLLLVGIATTTWQAVRATQEAGRATQAEKKATEESDAKTAALADAKATSKFLTDMFTRSRPGEEKGGREVKVADVLDRAAEKLETELADQPERRAVLQATLGATYHALGLYTKAIPLQEQAYNYCLTTYGPEHPDTLSTMNNLALSYQKVGRRDEALKMQEDVLTLSRKVLDPEHPGMLLALSNLAGSYSDAGRRDEALKIREELLPLYRKVNGLEYVDTLSAMNNLAVSYAEVGRQDEALEMQEEVLALRRKVNGPEHPDTLMSMQNLADSYSAVDRRDEALKMQEEMLVRRRKVLGPEHPDTLVVMNKLAASYSIAGRLDEALKMGEEALAIYRKVSGPEHPDTLSAMRNLAASYHRVGRHDEALKMQGEVLMLRRKVSGPEHLDTGKAAADLGILLDKLSAEKNDNGKKTIKAWQEAVRINPQNANVQYWLGKLLIGKNRLEEAVVTLRAASALYPSGPRGIEMRERLVKALNDLGREEEAEEVRRKLAALPGAVSKDSPVVQLVIVAPDSEWKWLHPTNGTDPAQGDPDFHSTFFTTGFDDATWQTGKDSAEAGGGFGYGDDGFKGVDIGTPASKEVGKSAYFRHRFTTAKEHTQLELRCQRDDGLIVYLDGKVVARNNMEEGEEAYLLPAADAVSNLDESTPYRIPLQDLTLPAGEHILAISLHNPGRPSSDLRIAGITLVEVETPEATPDGPRPDLTGQWLDMNDGEIAIEQDGAEVLATGQNATVMGYWTKAEGRLRGRSIIMMHYKDEKNTDTQRGQVSEDGSRLNWGNGSHWTRKTE